MMYSFHIYRFINLIGSTYLTSTYELEKRLSEINLSGDGVLDGESVF